MDTAVAAAATVQVDPQDLATCIRVLEVFHGNMDALKAAPFKALRRAVVPLCEDVRSRLFHGRDVASYDYSKKKKLDRKRKAQQAAALDKQFINNTKLRAQRLQALESLTAAAPMLALVPDGAVVDDAPDTPIDHEDEQPKTLHGFRSCYACKKRFDTLHHFYDQLCPDCAALNFEKRMQTADLTGYIALVTGARVKIGFHTALKLLRAGATVIATSRFPQDAAIRYANEADYDTWKSRLHVYGLDLRDLGGAEVFMDCIERTFHSLDIVINNATQTIRRPTHYYQHLLTNERRSLADTPDNIRDVLSGNASFQHALTAPHQPLTLTHASSGGDDDHGVLPREAVAMPAAAATTSAELSQVPLTTDDKDLSAEERAALYPVAQYDANHQQVDLRHTNSWKLKIDHVESPELAEVFAINALAPFILNKRAILLFEKSSRPHHFIVNVSAMEGKFYRYKTPHHPHTNMAKAAANMMTRTCADELKSRNIYMTSVDTGWINDENPRAKAQDIAMKHNFQTPLDEIDAAARILDPIFIGFQDATTQGTFPSGDFFKDYKRSEW
ncbi:hypothetical protein, variant [Aphanomyces invadans]|uniref:Oxidoreductase n=1 Tax=Aphanomyces invadans TaxID=157072 RepID=A0A024TFS7_9STRA|nr:hypothetical protein, variant [Aphanomyces invadans]ETV93010.1 hypothetical protein, variant [Aphanomyces invadans]|eukprot:XP_008878274.1 hypothetical protein, variant [Aphanomyces invadans]